MKGMYLVFRNYRLNKIANIFNIEFLMFFWGGYSFVCSMISLYIHGWPDICYIDQSHIDLTTFATNILELEAYVNKSNYFSNFDV